MPANTEDNIANTGLALATTATYKRYEGIELVEEITKSLLTDVEPVLTESQYQLLGASDVKARAEKVVELFDVKTTDFKIINNAIEVSALCTDEEDEFMIGQIIDFAGGQDKWDETKWMECAGQTLAVADYPELYEVIGREWTYNDNVPESSFRLPDLRTRVTLGFDVDDNASPRDSYNANPYQRTTNCGRVGNYGGRQFAQLGENEIPSHSHSMLADAGATGSGSDFTQTTGHVTKAREQGGNLSYRLGNSNLEPTLGLTGKKGSGQNHENRQPYAVVRKLIRYKLY